MMIWTPNIKKLIIQKVSLDAVPPGGGFASGVEFLLDKDRIVKSFKAAESWVQEAIATTRTAQEPNPFKESSDEEIAEEIMRRVVKRKEENLVRNRNYK